VRARLGNEKLAAILAEGAEVPADAAVRFEPGAVNLYADSWLVAERA
jgi:glycerol transport system ATP-binding protein